MKMMMMMMKCDKNDDLKFSCACLMVNGYLDTSSYVDSTFRLLYNIDIIVVIQCHVRYTTDEAFLVKMTRLYRRILQATFNCIDG